MEYLTCSHKRSHYVATVATLKGKTSSKVHELRSNTMIQTTNQKTKADTTDLPPGWKWKPRARGWQAINPSKNLKTSVFEGCVDAVAAAREIAEEDIDRGEDDPPPIEVYVEKAELDEMDRINACSKIHEGKPVKLYDHEG